MVAGFGGNDATRGPPEISGQDKYGNVEKPENPETYLEGIVSKKIQCAVSLRSKQKLDQGQKPEGSGSYAYYRREF